VDGVPVSHDMLLGKRETVNMSIQLRNPIFNRFQDLDGAPLRESGLPFAASRKMPIQPRN
jgi:hypothetical protein